MNKRKKLVRYGYKRLATGEIEKIDAEQQVIAMIRELAEQGLSACAIARTLRERHIPTRTRRGCWGHPLIISIAEGEGFDIKSRRDDADTVSADYESEIERRKAELLPAMRAEKDRIRRLHKSDECYTIPSVVRPVQRRGVHIGY